MLYIETSLPSSVSQAQDFVNLKFRVRKPLDFFLYFFTSVCPNSLS